MDELVKLNMAVIVPFKKQASTRDLGGDEVEITFAKFALVPQENVNIKDGLAAKYG